MSLHPKAIESILALSNEKRYEYAIKTIANTMALYVLADDEGTWSLWGDDEGHASLAVWPAQYFAEMALAHESDAEGLSVYELELEAFLTEGVPWLLENELGIALFPVPGNSNTTDMTPIQFAAVINQLLDEYYAEALDLPYLGDLNIRPK